MNDQTVTLNLNLVNAILNYLGSRPFAEVYQLVQAIQDAAQQKAEPPAEE
jgi:hypothetical protein